MSQFSLFIVDFTSLKSIKFKVCLSWFFTRTFFQYPKSFLPEPDFPYLPVPATQKQHNIRLTPNTEKAFSTWWWCRSSKNFFITEITRLTKAFRKDEKILLLEVRRAKWSLYHVMPSIGFEYFRIFTVARGEKCFFSREEWSAEKDFRWIISIEW